MWYIAAVAGIIVVGALAGTARSKGISFTKEGFCDAVFNAESVRKLSMEQVNFLLARLEREDAPDPAFGAMCYEAMAIPAVAEYVCPVCGEKTLYEDYQVSFILWELQGCRRLAESIDSSTEFRVILDESQFCDFCSGGNTQSPEILLRVIRDDGSETVNSVSISDLRMLDSFLQGRLYWVTENDGQEPLKNNADRMRELLGLPE